MADDPNAVADATAQPDAPVAPLQAAPAPVVDDKAARIEALIRNWQIGSLGNSPVSRNSEAWAHVAASLPALIHSIITEG